MADPNITPTNLGNSNDAMKELDDLILQQTMGSSKEDKKASENDATIKEPATNPTVVDKKDMPEPTIVSAPTPVVEDAPAKEEKPEKELSPLEQMIADKNAGKLQTGMVVDNNTFEAKERTEFKNYAENDERMNAISDYQDDLEQQIRNREMVVLMREPHDAWEHQQVIREISCVRKDAATGEVIIDLGTDDDGKPIIPKWIRPRKEDEGIFDFKAAGIPDPSLKQDENAETDEERAQREDEEKKAKTVQVIIDKTGLGIGAINFTDEEKEKLEEAEAIVVKEVNNLDIRAVRGSATKKSFQDVMKSYEFATQKTATLLPASMIKCQMKGMSYGEYADVAFDPRTVDFDTYYKRLSVCYDKICNLSVGEFKDFDDFLRNIAYTDIPIMIYNMYLSTEPDNQSITLECGNKPDCGETFNWAYNSRALIRLNECTDAVLSGMNRLLTASPFEYQKLHDESQVMKPRFIELPETKIVAEVGILSAYDFLYNVIPVVDDDAFEREFGDNESYKTNRDFLMVVRAMHIPDGSGGYYHATTYKEILDTLYEIAPQESKILNAYGSKYTELYRVKFSFGKVVCPHCGNITPDLAVDIDSLVFQTRSRLQNIDIDAMTLPGF